VGEGNESKYKTEHWKLNCFGRQNRVCVFGTWREGQNGTGMGEIGSPSYNYFLHHHFWTCITIIKWN